MRVIAGVYKGRSIGTVNDRSVRPAADRVKQAIFDMLNTRMEFEGSAVLDLFAGSGSLGIEALSRGAGHATFVEINVAVSRSIERNIRMLGCERKAEIITADALQFMQSAHDPFDLIFADPPYDFEHTPQLPELVFSYRLLNRGGYLLIEHTKDLHFASTERYRAGPEKRFGRTLVTFFQSV